MEGHGLAVLGDVHLACKRYDDASQCYEASLAIRRAIGDRRGEGWMLHNLANAHDREGRTAVARELVLQAAAIATEQSDAELSVASERMLRSLG